MLCPRFIGSSSNLHIMRIATSVFIGSSSNLQIKRTCIKSLMSSLSGQTGLFALELLALSADLFSHRLIMEKMLWTQ